MRYFATFALFLVSIFCGAQDEVTMLNKAFKKHSPYLLGAFLKQWSVNFPPITKAELDQLSEQPREAYRIFAIFYDYASATYPSLSDTSKKYLFLQNELDIRQAEKVFYTQQEIDEFTGMALKQSDTKDSLTEMLSITLRRPLSRCPGEFHQAFTKTKEDERKGVLIECLTNFRPSVSNGSKTPLYLSNHYDSIIKAFHHNPDFKEQYESIPDISDYASERRNFLSKHIAMPKNFRSNWNLYSFPLVNSIVFDGRMEYALVNYNTTHYHGEAILKRENNNWIIQSDNTTGNVGFSRTVCITR